MKSKKLRRSKKRSQRRSSRTSRNSSGRRPPIFDGVCESDEQAIVLAKELSEFMKNNVNKGDKNDENHINNKLMNIILPHQIYYGINGSSLEINSEGADPDDKPVEHLRYWTKKYMKYIHDINIPTDEYDSC
jgi:hypothetical protein